MPSVIIHIGTHKTGTTSIQRALAAGRHCLRVAGIVYPEAGCPESGPVAGHHLLAWAIRGKNGVARETPWDALQDELATVNPSETVLISSEEFEGFTTDEIVDLRTRLRDHDVEILAYLRRPTEFLASAYKQRVKMGTFSGSFRQFAHDRQHRIRYGDLYARWSSVFGADRIRFRVYEKACGNAGGLMGDFASAVGIDPGLLQRDGSPGPAANISPPDSVILALRLLNSVEPVLQPLGPARRWISGNRNAVQKGQAPLPLRLLSKAYARTPIITKASAQVIRSAFAHGLDGIPESVLSGEERDVLTS